MTIYSRVIDDNYDQTFKKLGSGVFFFPCVSLTPINGMTKAYIQILAKQFINHNHACFVMIPHTVKVIVPEASKPPSVLVLILHL